MADNTSGNSGGGTLKVTDETLRQYSDRLASLLTDFRENAAVKDVRAFAAESAGSFPSGRAKVLPGGTALGTAKELQDAVKGLFATLETWCGGTEQLVWRARLSLRMAQSTLQNAEDEALSAAQMMHINGEIVGGVGSPPATPPPKR